MNADALVWAMAQPAGTVWNDLAMAYAAGTTRVRFADGREVSYATTADMERVLVNGFAASRAPEMRRPLSVIARVGDGYR